MIGIYEEPPPEGAQPYIRSQRVADLGAVPLLRAATRARDRLFNAAEHLLHEL